MIYTAPLGRLEFDFPIVFCLRSLGRAIAVAALHCVWLVHTRARRGPGVPPGANPWVTRPRLRFFLSAILLRSFRALSRIRQMCVGPVRALSSWGVSTGRCLRTRFTFHCIVVYTVGLGGLVCSLPIEFTRCRCGEWLAAGYLLIIS